MQGTLNFLGKPMKNVTVLHGKHTGFLVGILGFIFFLGWTVGCLWILGRFGGSFLEDFLGHSKWFFIQFWRTFGRFFEVCLRFFFRLDFFSVVFFLYNTDTYILLYFVIFFGRIFFLLEFLIFSYIFRVFCYVLLKARFHLVEILIFSGIPCWKPLIFLAQSSLMLCCGCVIVQR